jgi:hypothetical protein
VQSEALPDFTLVKFFHEIFDQRIFVRVFQVELHLFFVCLHLIVKLLGLIYYCQNFIVFVLLFFGFNLNFFEILPNGLAAARYHVVLVLQFVKIVNFVANKERFAKKFCFCFYLTFRVRGELLHNLVDLVECCNDDSELVCFFKLLEFLKRKLVVEIPETFLVLENAITRKQVLLV